jgi:vacuolar-type H+-ATPase catalytic subunit A/Vma1
MEFLNQLNAVWDNDTFTALKQALQKTTTDLSNINKNQDNTTLVGQDQVSESQDKLANIETMAKNYVSQLYEFLEEYAYEKSPHA